MNMNTTVTKNVCSATEKYEREENNDVKHFFETADPEHFELCEFQLLAS